MRRKCLAVTNAALRGSDLTTFVTHYDLFEEDKIPKYTALFQTYIKFCSPDEATAEDRAVAEKFLAVFYCANEGFLAKKNVLESPHFLEAKNAFSNDFEARQKPCFQDQKSPRNSDYFLELMDQLWKAMATEAEWFGSEMPSLSVYKKNREVTILVHPFVEIYRALCFPDVDKSKVKELVSLVAQIIYHDNDLCSKHDEGDKKPNLVSLVVQDCRDLGEAKALIIRERSRLFNEFQQAKTVMTNPSLDSFIRFLDNCIQGNIKTMKGHQERYESIS